MKNLKLLLKRQLSNVPKGFVIAVLVVALLGFADATYLTLEHFRGVIPPCTTDGCETVLTSVYSKIAGVPVSLIGALYYLAVAISMVVYLDSKNVKVLKWGLLFTVFGLFCSVWFVFLQFFIVKAICQYCMISAATSAVLFVLACVAFKKYSHNEESNEANNVESNA